jgi:hypothetical protein
MVDGMTPAPKLHELIETVHADASITDQLELLAAASRLASELDDVSDALLGHFVDQCRRSGRSWTEISSALGVTKQAAHKRFSFTTPTLNRFTARARSVLESAGEAAGFLGHNYIGTEHVLLAMFDQPESIGAKVLLAHKVTAKKVRAAIEKRAPAKDPATPAGALAFTPRCAELIEGSLGEALKLGHNYIGTEHLLLAFYRDKSSWATEILTALGLTREQVLADVTRLLANP